MTNNNIINITPTLTNKQKQALRILLDNNNNITELLFGGGAGSGKTYIGCLWILLMCFKYSGTRYIIGRSKLKTLEHSTLATFFDICKSFDFGESDLKYNQQKSIIKFRNGSEIILKDLFSYPTDPEFDSLGSIECSGVFIDECNQISEKAKNIVMSRIRYKLDENGLIPKLFMSCNPSKNWVYNTFYRPWRNNTLEDYKYFIQALSNDNKFVSKHYVNNLNKLDYNSKQRLLFGIWENSNELSIINYDNIINMFNDYININSTIYMSIDVARLGKDKTVIMVWSGLKIVECLELSKLTGDLQYTEIKNLQNKYNCPVEHMCFDVDGVGGFLKDQFPGSIEIINNSKALNNENYSNLKTQLYFKLADKINNGEICCSVLNEDQELKLTQELQIINREKVDQDGKIYMTSKDQIKKQIGRSPDYSDCLAYRMIFEIDNKQETFVFGWV